MEPRAWLNLLKKMEVKPHPLIKGSIGRILSLVLDGMATKPDQSCASVRTVLQVSEGSMVESVVEEVCRVVHALEVISVTTDDMEIMLTPPTQLWHSQLWKE